MSYILEALKKAQAERQLGSAPTIHAPAQSYAAPAEQGAKRRYAAIGVGAGVLVALAALWWTRQGNVPTAAAPAVVAQAPAPAATPEPAPAPVAPAPVATPAPVAPSAPVTPPPAPAPVAAKPAPVAAAVPPVQEAAPARPAPAPSPAPAPQVREAAPRVAEASSAPAAPPVPAPTAVPAPAEETVRTLQQLPEAIQREVPKVAFGGYIYSPDPAERLLLVDKMLRREGEEVAPGLVLERLLPKAAVMNYRGYRYRVAY